MPKWEAVENKLRATGITPAIEEWPERDKHSWYGHGGLLDKATGEFIHRKQTFTPTTKLVNAMADAQAGLIRVDRENDKLTHALENTEHT
jgi:hypothetical protein